MAVDWGARRVGVALSDPTNTLASPRPVLEAADRPRLLADLERMARQEEVSTILVGLPAHMDGREGTSAEGARALGQELLRRMPWVEVRYLDERLTTRQARDLLALRGERVKKGSGRLDQVAAAILLQSYLDGAGA